MKIYLLACLLISTLVAGAEDENPFEPFSWKQVLDGEFDKDALYRLRVPGTVFDGCRAFPDDLRIIDEAGIMWPHYLTRPVGSQRFDPREVNIANRSMVEEGDPYLRLELEIKGDRKPHNKLVIDTGGSDFIRRVEVLGSADRKTWGALGEGYLIDHRSPSRVHNRFIHYTASDHPFVELRIHRNARAAQETISVDQLELGMNVHKPGEWEEVALEPIEVEEKPRDPVVSTSWYFSSGHLHRPIERLQLEIGEGEFARPVRVYGRASVSNKWQSVHNGEIHRLGNNSHLRISLPGFTHRELKIEIFHYDDAPLVLSAVKAEAVPRFLVFEAQGASPAALYYGASVHAPRYDLQRRASPDRVAAAGLPELGPRLANQFHRPPRFQTIGPWASGAAIAVVGLIIIWVVAGMLKQGGGLSE